MADAKPIRHPDLDPLVEMTEDYCVSIQLSDDDRVLVSIVIYGMFEWPSACERWFEPEPFS